MNYLRLDLSFLNKKIRAVCENELAATETYGIDVSVKLKSRLADISAADSVLELLTGKPAEIYDDGQINYKVDLTNEFKLVFTSNHIKLPLNSDGKIDWGSVYRIKILKIEKI